MNIQSALVRSILERWASYEWTVQGFGFIRTKLADIGRIHVWDSSLAVPRASNVHTHPWPLHSTIISGELINQRFEMRPADAKLSEAVLLPYMRSLIQTGEGGGLVHEPDEIQLLALPPEFYTRGQSYEQRPAEIHRTIAQDGTVTLLTRPQGPPDEHALTFWPRGTTWGSAEPKPARAYDVERVVYYALARWAAA